MKPVVSSLVALAIALAPLGAYAADKHAAKPASTKIAKHKKEKESADKAEKAEKADKGIVRVKHSGQRVAAKPAIHHASNVELSGKGHSEPKIDQGVSVVPASLTAKSPHLKTVSAKSSDMPKLPSSAKAGKHAAEKGARKSAEKKHTDDADDGQPERDEDTAELVARIRGKSDKNEKKSDKSDKLDDRDDPPPKGKHSGAAKGPCLKDPVEVVRGPEVDRFELTTCEGAIAPLAIEHLSILVRPGSAARPTMPVAELAKKKGPELAAGIKRVDPRIVERLQAIVDHFGKKGTSPKLSVISGYRPMSIGSMHASGRAVDFRFEGVKNEEVVTFCKTLVDTGCGFYPNSSFVHLDVRDLGVGHVSWIDASGPGETPRYVSTWPPAPVALRHARLHQSGQVEKEAPLDRENVPEPVDEHPGEVSQ